MGRIMIPKRSINFYVVWSWCTDSGPPSGSFSFGTAENSSLVIRNGREDNNSSEASNAQVKMHGAPIYSTKRLHGVVLNYIQEKI
jgi:hypothetical protein